METIQKILTDAINLHQAGELKQAERLYRHILEHDTDHADALHFLGLIAYQTGKNEIAINYIKKAIKLSLPNALYFLNLGNVYFVIGRFNKSEESFIKSLAIKPDYADAHYYLGRTFQVQREMDKAIHQYQETVQLNPDYPDAYFHWGNILMTIGKIEAAIKQFRQAVQFRPNFPEAHFNFGNALKIKGDLHTAISSYKEALRWNPEFTEVHCNLGNILNEMGRSMEALDSYKEALRLKPDYAEAYFNLGNTLQTLGHFEKAVPCYHDAIRNKPGFNEAYTNLSAALYELGEFDEGLNSAHKAVQLKPDNPYTLNILGNLYKQTDHYQQAKRCFQQAIQLKPDFAEPYNNLGSTYLATRELDKALSHYNKALALLPDFVEARWSRSLLYLLTENFKEGWLDYEWRWKKKDFVKIKRRYTQPQWDGTPLPDKTILIYAEQGYGDTIHFIRYVPLVKQHVKNVIVEAHKPLIKLLSSCSGIDQLISLGTAPPEFDLHIPLLSLPGIFQTDLNNIPDNNPYLSIPKGLKTDTSLVSNVKSRLKIGIVWAGNPDHKNDRNRCCPVSQFLKLQQIPEVTLFSLQKGPQKLDLHNINAQNEIVDLSHVINDFSDTAVIIKKLDLIITVDTAVAHLAGALNHPVWILLPYVPEWRWFLKRDDSPWYPSMRLFRQTQHGNWEGVFNKVIRNLSPIVKKSNYSS